MPPKGNQKPAGKKPATKAAAQKKQLPKEKVEARKKKLLRGIVTKAESKAPKQVTAAAGVTKQTKTTKPQQRRLPKDVAFEVTFNLGKATKEISRKRKAPRGVREIKRFVRAFLGTSDVRVDPSLNKYVWMNSISNPPRRVRLVLNRKPNEQEGEEGKYFVHVSNVLVDTFSGKSTKKLETSATAAQ